MRGKRGNWLIVFAFVLAGVFVGNRAGEALRAVLPAAARYGEIAVPPRDIALLDLAFTLGFKLKVNLAGALGALAGIALARRI